MGRAAVASAASSSRASWASTRGSRPTSRATLTSAARRRGGWRTASSSTRSAPADRSWSSWRASTTKSFARTGTWTASRTRVRSATEPPKACGSHRTEIATAPPRSYARARATTSSSRPAMRPADGDDRLISAIRWRPGPASRSTIGRGGDAVGERRRAAGDQERGGGVQDDDVAPGPALSGEDRLDDRGVLGRGSTSELRGLRAAEPEVRSPDLVNGNPGRRDVMDDAGPIERQLVDARPMDDDRSLGAEQLRHGRDSGRDGRVPDSDNRAFRAGRVGERPHEVERRPHADLATGRAGVSHRRMEARGKEEGKAELAQVVRGRLGIVIDPDPERVEDVGRTGTRGDRPVAVLRDGDAGRGDDERGRGGDVER